MSKPVQKIVPTPESYTPKNKPEILNMTEKRTGKNKMEKYIK